ncbi:unnamed protein product, partial [Onchocerca ochengi]
VRHQNDAKSRGAFVELKTYAGGTVGTSTNLHPNITGHVSVPQLRAKARLKEEKEKDMSTVTPSRKTINRYMNNVNGKESDSITLPQITVNDSVEKKEEINHKGRTSDNIEQLTTAAVKEQEELEKASSSQESAQQQSTSTVVEQVMSVKKQPSTNSSYFRSERSDEMSLRSIKRALPYKREKMPVSVGIVTVILFIAGGAILFSVWEGWNFFDGAYYSFITL